MATIHRGVRPFTTRESFAHDLYVVAHSPRSRRGDLNSIEVTGSVEELTHPQADDPGRYRFSAEFMRSCSGQNTQFQTISTYSSVGTYTGTFNEPRAVMDNLTLIQEALAQKGPSLKSDIKGTLLAVENTFFTCLGKDAARQLAR